MFNKSLPMSVIYYIFSFLNHSLFTKDISWNVSPFQINHDDREAIEALCSSYCPLLRDYLSNYPITRLIRGYSVNINLLHQDLNLPPPKIENSSHLCSMCGELSIQTKWYFWRVNFLLYK